MKKFALALAMSMGLTASAHADGFVISGGSSIPINGNDFLGTLNSHGLTAFKNTLSSLSVDTAGTITLYAFANESFLFTEMLRDGTPVAVETNSSGIFFYDPAGDHFPGVQVDSFNVAAGDTFCNACSHSFNFRSTGPAAGGIDASVGDAGFGIFYNPGDLSTIALAYDDAFPPDDDNHDDLIVIAKFTATVPEASTWALMIAAFGFLAMAQRRRARQA